MLESMGAEMVRIEPEATDFDLADAALHPNLCSYAKAVLEDFAQKDYDGIVLTTCCDSIRRLYDVLHSRYPDKFIYLLDFPRIVNDFSASLFEVQIKKLAEAYGKFSGNKFSADIFRKKMPVCHGKINLNRGINNSGHPSVIIAGARCGRSFLDMVRKSGAYILSDITCTGLERKFNTTDMPENSSHLFRSYAGQLLCQVPCMRMTDLSRRKKLWQQLTQEADGIVYHTVKFCDNYSFEYAAIRRKVGIPVLKVETDTTPQCEGQLRTRVEAFLESLRANKKYQGESTDKSSKSNKNKIYVLGIDSGSTSTNAVIIDGEKHIIADDTIPTGAKVSESAEKIRSKVTAKAGLAEKDITMTVTTGYGRVSIPFADGNVTEISCHGKGAQYFNPNVHTILDIGGQDSKAIRLNGKGEIADFVMNDKCAAGTGRFLEAMARTLELDVSELGPISMKSTKAVAISSMCTVFAESEVISLIAQNKEKADIVHGIHNAIAGKAFSLLSRVEPQPEYMMTGGVAHNAGVVKAVEEKLGAKLYICPKPEIVGAVGAALVGLEKVLSG